MPLRQPPPDDRHAATAAEVRRAPRLLALGVAGAILAFAVPAMLWALVPIYRPTDEPSHVAYARELSHGRLPTIETPISSDGDPRLAEVLGPRDALHRTIWTANHPPLYYAVAAVPLSAGSAIGHPTDGVAAARLLSVLLTAAGLAGIAYVVLQLVPGRPQLAVAATGLAAVLPSLINASAVVYNDSLAFLTSTVALAASVVFVLRGPSYPRLTAVATFAALAALTRASGLLVAGVAGLAVLAGVWRAGEGAVPRRLGRAVAWAAVVGVAVATLAGWFYARNLTLYGDLTGSAYLLDRFDRTPGGTILGLLTDPAFWGGQQRRLVGLSFNQPIVGQAVLGQLWLLGFLPLAGLLLAGARRLARATGRHGHADRGSRPADLGGRVLAVGLCVLLLALAELSMVQFASAGGTAHVRYLFPGLATLALGAAAGLAALPGGRRGLPAIAVVLVLGVANLWARSAYVDLLGPAAPAPPLALLAPPLLVGIGALAWALWRLAPAAPPVDRVARAVTMERFPPAAMAAAGNGNGWNHRDGDRERDAARERVADLG